MSDHRTRPVYIMRMSKQINIDRPDYIDITKQVNRGSMQDDFQDDFRVSDNILLSLPIKNFYIKDYHNFGVAFDCTDENGRAIPGLHDAINILFHQAESLQLEEEHQRCRANRAEMKIEELERKINSLQEDNEMIQEENERLKGASMKSEGGFFS